MPVVTHPWTDQEIEKVKEYSAKNMTAKQIAEALNEESGGFPRRTKNAVIGVMSRRGLHREDTFNKLTKKIVRKKTPPPKFGSYTVKNFAGRYDRSKIKLTPVTKPLPKEKPLKIDKKNSKTILTLGPFDCRAVLGNPNGAITRYCGKPVMLGSSWCADHQLVYVVEGKVP